MSNHAEDAVHATIREWRRDAETTDNEEERLRLAMDALVLWRVEAANWMQWALEIVRKNAPEQPSRQADAWFFLQLLQNLPPAGDWDFACLPADLLAELTEALQALPFGEVQPILKPATSSLHQPAFSLGLARLLAVEHVEFLAGKGLRVEVARETVATALGVTGDALEWWRDKLLPKGIGKDRLTDARRAARKAGKLALAMDRGPGLEIWRDVVEKAVADALERHEVLDLAQLRRGMQSLQRNGLLANEC